MKRGGAFFISVVVFAGLQAAYVFADTSTVALESRIIETWAADSPYQWVTDGIRYATKKDAGTFAVYPQALYRSPAEAEGKMSFGLNGQFQRQGYNWIDIYPVNKDTPDSGAVPIPLEGLVHAFDMWVWGSNLNYTLEAYIRDYRGILHRINFGSLAFLGWKNLRASVPPNFPMYDRALPVKKHGSEFIKFRLWTGPQERVNNFYVYFNQLKILTDPFRTRFDGDDLADDAQATELWSSVKQ